MAQQYSKPNRFQTRYNMAKQYSRPSCFQTRYDMAKQYSRPNRFQTEYDMAKQYSRPNRFQTKSYVCNCVQDKIAVGLNTYGPKMLGANAIWTNYVRAKLFQDQLLSRPNTFGPTLEGATCFRTNYDSGQLSTAQTLRTKRVPDQILSRPTSDNHGHRGADVSTFDLALITQIEHMKQVPQIFLSQGRTQFGFQVLDQKLCFLSITLLRQAVLSLFYPIVYASMSVMFQLFAYYTNSQCTKGP